MKKYWLLALFVVFSVAIFGCTQGLSKNSNSNPTTQKTSQKSMESEEEMMAEEGFEMTNGKMMMVNEKTKISTAMERDATLNDGTKVMTDGKVVRKDGTSFMLKENESIWMDGSFMEAGELMEEREGMTGSFKGKLLAGTASKYIEFNKADYGLALKENKKILLYFYAGWCPTCRAEQPETFAAFDELDDPDLIGFRVNFRDSDADADEEALAKEFGVSYQHTKVILKDGQRVLKAPDSWGKQRYLDELAKV